MKMCKVTKNIVSVIQSSHANLTLRHTGMLLVLDAVGSGTVRGLATYLRVGRPCVTNGMNKLQALGLIKRELDQNDKRSVNLSLTEDGIKLVQKLAA